MITKLQDMFVLKILVKGGEKGVKTFEHFFATEN